MVMASQLLHVHILLTSPFSWEAWLHGKYRMKRCEILPVQVCMEADHRLGAEDLLKMTHGKHF
jgi:hypothetical protein